MLGGGLIYPFLLSTANCSSEEIPLPYQDLISVI
jgi:hypothetical protein